MTVFVRESAKTFFFRFQVHVLFAFSKEYVCQLDCSASLDVMCC